ncbi:protein kinase [Acidobacteriota bacterium]
MTKECHKCQHENPDDTAFCGKCGTKFDSDIGPTKTLETPSEELSTGSTFAGRYQIIEELGKGGMGKVYKVLDKETKEKIALKLIKPEIAFDKKTIERFRNELITARKIVQKNVCRMYDLNKETGRYYITMEYIEGQNLKELIRQTGQLTVGKAISLAKQICDGLAEAHSMGVVHRDLKPNNIMIDRGGNAKIMDFGIARAVKGKGITGSGVVIGTPQYMSPEQVEGKDVDQRSDIYSLGIILYEMLTDRVPFEGDTPLTIGVKQKTETPKEPKDFNERIPDDLNRLILKCLEKDREDRNQSTDEVRSDLRRLEQGLPTTDTTTQKRKSITSREITVKFSVKRLFIPFLIAVFAIAAVLILWNPWNKRGSAPIPSDKPTIAIMYFENNTRDETWDEWRKSLADLLTNDLAQSLHFKVVSGDRLFEILKDLNLLETATYTTRELKKVAESARADYLIVGKYNRLGQAIVIDVLIKEADTFKTVETLRENASNEEDIMPKVDSLTKRIKAQLGLSAERIEQDTDKEIGTIVTHSPEALRYYIEGREYHHKGELEPAVDLMKKAIAADPSFALAYRSLWAAGEGDEYIQRAFDLRERASDEVRLWIEGNYYSKTEKTYDKSIEAFIKLKELKPENRIAGTNLGMKYNFLEEWDKAIEAFEIPIRNKETTYYPYDFQARSYMSKGENDKAEDILVYYLENIADDARIRYRIALNYFCQGKHALALVEVDKALSLDPILSIQLLKGDIHLCLGDLAKAELEYKKSKRRLSALFVLQRKFRDAQDHLGNDYPIASAYVYLKSGDPDKALNKCDSVWSSAIKKEDLSQQRRILHLKGLAHLEKNAVVEAQRTAEELRILVEEGFRKKHIRYYHHLLGTIEFIKGNVPEAVEYFEQTLANTPSQEFVGNNESAIFLESLAYAYFKLNDLEKAQEQYEKIISLTLDRIYYGDIFAKSFYMLGKIYEQQGWPGKAIENYDKFLVLWKDADPGFPEVDDAKKRLAGLKSH